MKRILHYFKHFFNALKLKKESNLEFTVNISYNSNNVLNCWSYTIINPKTDNLDLLIDKIVTAKKKLSMEEIVITMSIKKKAKETKKLNTASLSTNEFIS